MTTLEAPFEMANLFPKHTGLPFVVWISVRGGARHDIRGLPFVVWISVRGGARHDIRVKVSASAKANPGELISVGIRPAVHVIDGELAPEALAKLTRWIELNRETLIAYWHGEIDTLDALAALEKV